jgi:membrane associated rhomboid family serine protease
VFIPFGFEYAYQRTAWATRALLLANLVVCLTIDVTHTTGDHPFEQEHVTSLALHPRAFRVWQLVTHAFLHDGLLHFLWNAIFLGVFGRYVEDRLGPARFALLYLASAVFAGLVHLALGGGEPAVGASGAISALMGYVLVAAPWLEMRFAFLFGSFASRGMELAAGWLLVPWVLMQVVEASIDMSDVAVAAHLGGFAFGVGAAALMRSRFAKDTDWYIDPRPPQGGRAAVDRLRRARGG